MDCHAQLVVEGVTACGDGLISVSLRYLYNEEFCA